MTISAQTDTGTDDEPPVPLAFSPKRGRDAYSGDLLLLDPDLRTSSSVLQVSNSEFEELEAQHETIETFSHGRSSSPLLWESKGTTTGGAAGAVGAGGSPVSPIPMRRAAVQLNQQQSRDRAVWCQSREHAMAEAVRKSLKVAIQQKGRRVCGQQVESPADIFRIFDTDGSGKLSPDEMKSALRRLGVGYNDEQLGRLSEFLENKYPGQKFALLIRVSKLNFT